MNRIFHISIFLISLASIFIAEYFLSDYALRTFINILIFIILAVSYNLINGVTGQFSLEPNGFVAVGAYVSALLLLDVEAKEDQFSIADPHSFILFFHYDNFAFALILSGLCALALSLVLAFAVFRVRGDYLAIVTLGFGIIIKLIALNNAPFTNGVQGLNDVPQPSNFLYWVGFITIISVILMINLIYSKYGRAMKAVRDDEDAALAMGINTFRIKTLAFGTSAFFEGVAGGLLACYITSVTPEQFDFLFTFQLLIIIVLGGLGSTTGAIVGAILVMGGAEWLRFLDEPMNIFGYETLGLPGLRMLVFSIILILVMLFARRGIFKDKELIDFIPKKRLGK